MPHGRRVPPVLPWPQEEIWSGKKMSPVSWPSCPLLFFRPQEEICSRPPRLLLRHRSAGRRVMQRSCLCRIFILNTNQLDMHIRLLFDIFDYGTSIVTGARQQQAWSFVTSLSAPTTEDDPLYRKRTGAGRNGTREYPGSMDRWL